MKKLILSTALLLSAAAATANGPIGLSGGGLTVNCVGIDGRTLESRTLQVGELGEFFAECVNELGGSGIEVASIQPA